MKNEVQACRRAIATAGVGAMSVVSRCVWFALLCVLLGPVEASAQTAVQANQPIPFAWTHPEADTATNTRPTHYRVLIDGQEVAAKIPVGTKTYTHAAGVAPGNHTAVVFAVNPYGQAASEELQFVAGLPPAAPSGLEIVVTTTATLRVEPKPDGSLAVNVVRVGSDVSQVSTTAAPSTDR